MPNENEVIQLRDKTTGQPHSVPIADLQTALASGDYEQYEGSSVHTNRLGTTVRVNPNEAGGVIDRGENFINPNAIGSQQATEQQREAFNNMGDKALTFAEGFVDALSIGVLHEHGDMGEVRRDVNSGSALAGQIAGMIVGSKGLGPTKGIIEGGEAAGRAAAGALFKGEGVIASLGTHALTEAGGGGLLMGAGATGHQISDAIFDNKPIAVETIIHEAGMGALLAGSAGLLGEGFAKSVKGASHDAVSTGAGLDDFISKSGTHFDESITSLDNALNTHETRIGVLDTAAKEGLIPADFMQVRRDALEAAQKAGDKLKSLGSAEGALSDTPIRARKWQEAAEDYSSKVEELNRQMSPKLNELGLNKVELGKPEISNPIKPAGDDLAESGTTTKDVLAANDVMNNSPWGKAKYQELHGRPWESIPTTSGEPALASNFEQDASNLGGKVTPTSNDVTQVKRIRSIDESPKSSYQPKPIDNVLPAGSTENAGSFKDFLNYLEKDVHIKQGYQDRVGNINPGERASMDQEVFGPGPEPIYKSDEGPIYKAQEPRLGNLSESERTTFNNEANKVGQDVVLTKHEKFKQLMDDWFKESSKTLKPSPYSEASTITHDSMDKLNTLTGGRMDAAGSLDFAKKAGFNTPNSLLGERFQQAWSVRRATEVAATASRVSPKSLFDISKGMIARRVGRMAGGAVAGKVIGGDTGATIGAALAGAYTGFTGRIAGSMSRMYEHLAKAGEALLRGKNAVIVGNIVAANRPWSYSDKGPIKDPIERIQEIQHVAAHPDMIDAKIRQSSGDLAVVHPEMHDLLTKVAQHRIMALSLRAPKFMWGKWGNALPPAVGELRRFLEYENAVNDLEGTLKAAQSGTVTKDQADGLRDGWPGYHLKLSQQLLADPSTLSKLPASKLQSIQNVTGASLDNLSDGNYIERQQSNWVNANQQSSQNQPSSAPQAFKINAHKMPDATPTTSQSFNGRAPGN